MRDPSTRRFLRFVMLVALLALGGVCGLVLRVVLGGGEAWGAFVLPLALVAGMIAWGVVAFTASVVRALRERSLSSLLRPLPDPPGALCVPFCCVLSGPLLGVSIDTSWMAVGAGTVTAVAYGALAYGLARSRWLDPAGLDGSGEP
jgi:hypothetical protein